MLKVFVRLQIAARHQRVGHAHGRGAAEGRFHVELVKAVQKTARNGVQNVLPVVVPELLREMLRDFVQPRRHIVFAGSPEPLLQRRRNRAVMLLAVFPKPRTPSVSETSNR